MKEMLIILLPIIAYFIGYMLGRISEKREAKDKKQQNLNKEI